MPNKTDKTVIQGYLQKVYATFSDSLTLITDIGKDLKNKLFQEVAKELGTKHQFLTPDHPQSNSILEKLYILLKACVRKHMHSKMDKEDIQQISCFSFRMFPAI